MELTTEQVAERLGISDGRVRQLIRAGALPYARRVGGAYLLRPEDVDAFKAGQAPQTVGYRRGRPRTRATPREGTRRSPTGEPPAAAGQGETVQLPDPESALPPAGQVTRQIEDLGEAQGRR